MITEHNVGTAHVEHESERLMGTIQRHVTLVTLHIITYTRGRERLTLRTESLGRGSLLPQNVVQPALGSAQPLDPDVRLAPRLLEVRTLPVGNRFRYVERTTVPEVQARPPAVCHADRVGEPVHPRVDKGGFACAGGMGAKGTHRDHERGVTCVEVSGAQVVRQGANELGGQR